MKNGIDNIFRYLPIRISCAINRLPEALVNGINEIRLRKNAPLSITVGQKNLCLDESGRICNLQKSLRVRESEMLDCLAKLTHGSLYTCDEYISQGFIPLAEGGRAGVCGRSNRKGFAEITSINLRVYRFLPDVARPLVEKLNANGICGVIVCSPPAMGKTTFLRSAAYLLSVGKGISPVRVGVADERCEIAVGIGADGLLDVISSMPKSDAMTILTRTMSPEVIICDEIGAGEVEAVLELQNTGVSLIASAHCNSPSELMRRGRLKMLIEQGVFRLCVMLGHNGLYTCEIAETEAFL